MSVLWWSKHPDAGLQKAPGFSRGVVYTTSETQPPPLRRRWIPRSFSLKSIEDRRKHARQRPKDRASTDPRSIRPRWRAWTATTTVDLGDGSAGLPGDRRSQP